MTPRRSSVDPVRRCLVVLLLALAPFIGCASLKNTPAQDRALDAWAKCGSAGGGMLGHIEPDGRIHYSVINSTANIKFIEECLARERQPPAAADYAAVPVRQLVRHAHFVAVAPTAPLHEMPPKADRFAVGAPIPFFLVLHNSTRELRAEFKWYRPDGQLAYEDARTLRDVEGAGPGSGYWTVATLPRAHVQQVGRWRLEVYLDNELVERSDFRVGP